MTKGAKILITLIFIFCMAVMYLAFLLVQKTEAEKKKRVFVEGELHKTEQKLVSIEKEKEQVARQLNDVIEVKEQLQVERDKAKEEAYKLSVQLEKEKKEKKQLQAKLEEKQKKALQLMKQLQEEKAEKQKLGERLDALQKASSSPDSASQTNALLQKLQKAQEEKEELTRKLREMSVPENPVKIRDIIVQADRKFSGSVLTVNKEFNFIIIDIGSVDGIIKGTELIVHRGKKLVGKVKVEKVYDKMSAATIIPKWMQDEVREDDSVKKF